ncbi:MAG: diaminobutyrate acetyltransferase [Deltaproteobacteria bacterium]
MDLKKDPTDIYFRQPEIADAPFMERLVKASPPLDLNSLYCYLIVCAHFFRTSVVACDAGAVCGFISAYVRPGAEDTLFVWQVAVDKTYRGKGIARSMLSSLLNRTAPHSPRYLETTVSPSNIPSKALFSSLAASLGAPLMQSVLFSADDFGESRHEEEVLFRIGPLDLLSQEEI